VSLYGLWCGLVAVVRGTRVGDGYHCVGFCGALRVVCVRVRKQIGILLRVKIPGYTTSESGIATGTTYIL
jgi:hypothetical protein